MDEPEEDIESHSYEIVGGVNDPADMAVGMMRIDLTQVCTLTMVYDRFGLTARHCVLRRNGDGSIDLNSPFDPLGMQVTFSAEPENDAAAVYYGVKTYRFHPEQDIAVVELSSVPPNHMPMNYTPIDGMVNQQVRIAGYGKTGSNNFDTGIRRNGYSTLFRTANMRNLGEVMVTGLAVGQSGSKLCQGDSGGPVFMVVDGTEKLVGVNSVVARAPGSGAGGAISCEAPETLNAHVRIDANQDWIHEAITDMEGGHTALIGGCAATDGGSAGWLLFLLVVAGLHAQTRRHRQTMR